MTLRALLLLALLPFLAVSGAAAQPAPAPANPAPPQDQLDRIEHKLDELLSRLPLRPADVSSAPTAAAGAPGTVPASSTALAAAGGPASASAEYRPGVLAVVRPASDPSTVLAVPADSVGGFVYEGGTLRLDDLSSRGLRYRAPAGIELQGWLRARESGRYQVAVDFGSPRAGAAFVTLTCGIALWLEDRQVGQHSGELSLSPGSPNTGPLSLVLGAELQPGLYRMRLWVACARPNTPVPITADVLLKAPSELNLHGVTAEDVVHRQE